MSRRGGSVWTADEDGGASLAWHFAEPQPIGKWDLEAGTFGDPEAAFGQSGVDRTVDSL